MSYKMMLKMMWLKVRYGVKSYLFFLLGAIVFISIFIINLLVLDAADVIENQSMFMVSFLYISVAIAMAIQTIEYSPCHYLVPRTSKDRKKFIVFQNLIKMILSFLGTTILFIIGITIQPMAAEYLFYWYLLTGISFSVILGANGYSIYYFKKRKISYKAYIVMYTITVIVMCAIIISGMFFINQKTLQYGKLISFVGFFSSIGYHMYYYVRFQKVDAFYENINREERKFSSRGSNSMM